MRKYNAKQCKRQNNRVLRQANFPEKTNFPELITRWYIAKERKCEIDKSDRAFSKASKVLMVLFSLAMETLRGLLRKK
jgi:hypothetical protein